GDAAVLLDRLVLILGEELLGSDLARVDRQLSVLVRVLRLSRSRRRGRGIVGRGLRGVRGLRVRRRGIRRFRVRRRRIRRLSRLAGVGRRRRRIRSLGRVVRRIRGLGGVFRRILGRRRRRRGVLVVTGGLDLVVARDVVERLVQLGDPGPVSPVTFTAVVRTGDDADRLVAHHHGTAGVTRDGQRLGGETVDHREVPRLRVRDERVAVDDVADDAVVLAADGAFLHGRGAARTPHLVTDVVHCDVADTGDRVRRRVEVVAARGRP